MKRPIHVSRFDAAHAIAKELRVDPEHPGTLRLAAALDQTPGAEPAQIEQHTDTKEPEVSPPTILLFPHKPAEASSDL